MFQQNRGHIVSIASIAGYTGLAGAVDYCSSKFAAVGLMEALRQELLSQKKTGIQLTTVCPSLITTGMFDGVRFRLVKFLMLLYEKFICIGRKVSSCLVVITP